MIRCRSLIAALALFAAAPAIAQSDQWTKQVESQLAKWLERLGSKGYDIAAPVKTGSLKKGTSMEHMVRLTAGTAYALVGTCDNDCSDIDLRLYNSFGVEVQKDIEADDFPVVMLTPPRTGEYKLRIIMVQCTSEPCRYGFGVYGK